MRRFGKYSNLIYLLLAIAALEFIGLAGLLLSGAAGGEPDAAVLSGEEDAPSGQAEDPGGTQSGEPGEARDPAVPEQEEPPGEKAKPAGERTGPEILSGAQLITHGMGAVDGVTVLNCLEGFQAQYDKGVRVFEVDLRLTRDHQVVRRHDWRAGWQSGISETSIPELKEFLARPILHKYTPLSFRDLLLLMEEHPDICVVTDTKFLDAEIVTLEFEAMLQDAEELGLSYLFDRMVIQVYSPLMFRVVDTVHHFPNYIYTLYSEGFAQTEDAFREKAAFCQENGILGVTMWSHWWREAYAPIAQEYGVAVYTHTVNDPETALRQLEGGVSAVYTDLLTPEDLEDPADAAESENQPQSSEEGA